MTSFDTAKNALSNMTPENATRFREDMKKVGDVFNGIKSDCSEEQLQELSELLEGASASGCVDGLAKEIDQSGFLGMDDDELFAMLFFQKILEQVT